MGKPDTAEIMNRALAKGIAIPAFNVPYLPMMGAVVRALRDTRCFGLISVARLEWMKFQAGSPGAVRDEYERQKDERYTRLHLDHVPVVDEDDLTVDYRAVLTEAVDLGYDSVMVDGSRLPLGENIAATKAVVALAHASGVPVEAELGAVLGHEEGPLPPYEELFASGRGFTDPAEAARFVEETGVDWLSVAVGSVHGAISATRKDKQKVAAKLDIPHLGRLRQATGIPLVLHGGSGIPRAYITEAVRHGIAKINVGTAIRQPYEAGLTISVAAAQEDVYSAAVGVVRDELGLTGSADVLLG